MSRAFMKENDGLGRCRIRREECLYADEDGICRLEKCRKEEDEASKRPKVTNVRIERPAGWKKIR